jgi:hypothetical protein
MSGDTDRRERKTSWILSMRFPLATSPPLVVFAALSAREWM